MDAKDETTSQQDLGAKRRVSGTDVARKAGVSQATVSYVLNGRLDIPISEETRRRVLAVAQEMGYRPNHLARKLLTGRTKLVGVWLPRPYSPYYAQVLQHLQEEFAQCGFEALVKEVSHQEAGRLVQSEWHVDGVVAVDCLRTIQAFLQDGTSVHTPLVSIGVFHHQDVDYVGVDLYGSVVEVVEHLLAIGCRRVAYLSSLWTDAIGDQRYPAFAEAMRLAGETPERIILEEDTRAAARQTVKEYICAHGCPDGIFCRNDDMALGAFRGLRDLGLRIPDDVALVGCSAIEETEYLDPPLTSIAIPIGQMCRLAWQFLKQRLEAPSLPLQQETLYPHLVIRESSRRILCR